MNEMTIEQFCCGNTQLLESMIVFIELPNLMNFRIPELAPFGWWAEVAALAQKYVHIGEVH